MTVADATYRNFSANKRLTRDEVEESEARAWATRTGHVILTQKEHDDLSKATAPDDTGRF